jgi:hypothetical protein
MPWSHSVDRVDASGCISFVVYPETSLMSSLLLSVSCFVKNCHLGSHELAVGGVRLRFSYRLVPEPL